MIEVLLVYISIILTVIAVIIFCSNSSTNEDALKQQIEDKLNNAITDIKSTIKN